MEATKVIYYVFCTNPSTIL